MFGFLKDKLKKAISKFTTDVKEEVNEMSETKNVSDHVQKSKIFDKVEVVEEQPKKEVLKEVKEKKIVEKPHSKLVEKTVEKIPKKEEVHKKEESKKIHSPKEELKAKKEIEKEAIHHPKKAEEKILEKKHEHISKKEEVKHEKITEEKKHEPIIRKEEKLPEKVHEKKIESTPKKEEIKYEKIIEEKKPVEVKKHIPVQKVQESKPELVAKHEKQESKEIKKEAKEEKQSEPKKSGFFGKLFSKKDKKEEQVIDKVEEKVEETKKEVKSEKEELAEEPKKGFFEKLTEVVTKKTLSSEKFDELFFELEIVMLENNVALEVIEKIKDDMKKSLLSEKVSRVKTEEIIAESLRNSIDELFDVETVDIFELAKKKKPFVICFVGVNGSGKTTNLAKLANHLQKNGLSVVIAACDTFRAAAIQQIEEHAKKLDIKLIKHDYGADAAAVAYDAIEHAKAKGKDIVLIDTAGRSHANVNLMEELEKVVRISKPDMKIFVGDSLTGNDAVDQAKSFNEKVGIDGIILSKVDVDDKGGAAISVSYITQKPILFIGTGQTYDDFEEFDKNKIIQNLGF